MEQDKMRDEALEKIAEKWRDAAALGCVNALECALREAWQASREAVVVELPEGYSAAFIERQPAHKREMFYLHNVVVYDCRAAIHAAGIRTR